MKEKRKNVSKQHAAFLRAQKKKSALVTLCRIGILLFLLVIWEALTRAHVMDAFITSSPTRILSTMKSLFSEQGYLKHIGVTLYETLLGFAVATLLGTLIAVGLWWSTALKRVFEPYLVVLNSLPKIALGPVIIVWFGTGMKSIVFMTVLVTVIVTIMTMQNGFSEVEEGKVFLMRSLGAKKGQIFTKLVAPAALPSFISMLKINVGMSWIGSIMGEYLASRAGLGYLIVYGGQVFKLDLVMAATVTLCALAGGMYFLVAGIEKLLLKKIGR